MIKEGEAKEEDGKGGRGDDFILFLKIYTSYKFNVCIYLKLKLQYLYVYIISKFLKSH